MEQTTATTIEPEGGCVFIKEVRMNKYGRAEAVLGGDTYEILSGKGEGVADDIDWDEHHCSFDWNIEEWTMDYDGGAVDALAGALADAGHLLGGVAERVIRELDDLLDENFEGWWGDQDIRVRVFYESKRSGDEKTKEGTVVAVDHEKRSVTFRRDDGVCNVLRGSSIYSQSDYPYMGDVTRVEVDARSE